MNKAKRIEIFSRLQTQNPNPTTELEYNNTFELLVAVVLSAQSTDVGVNKATAKLFNVANTPEGLLDLGIEGISTYIKTLGLYNSKAKYLVGLCRQLIERHQGEVPNDRKALEALPGVGRKTANVVLNTAFGKPTIAVDTHIFRVSNRTKLATGSTVDAVEQRLLRLTPEPYKMNAHHWLILHGRYICTARKPKCQACIIVDLCEYSKKTAQ